MASFAAQIEILAARYKKRLRAAAKEAVQQTVELAQLPTGDGGRMRVVTGFLRASIAGSVGSMPSGVSVNPNPREKVTYDGEAISAAIAKWNPELGETLFIGWTANYSRPREFHDGFLRGATEKWDGTVSVAALKARLSL